MNSFLLRRLGDSILTILGVTIVTFLFIRLIPGDPVDILLGMDANVSPERADEIRAIYGLDRPIASQYVAWLQQTLRGDLGVSIRSGQPIGEMLAGRLPRTLELSSLALGIAVVAGVPVGMVAALRRGRASDSAARLLALIAMSIPNFVIATTALLVGSLLFRWTPELSYLAPSEDLWGHLVQLTLPAVALSAISIAFVARMMRSSLLDVMEQDHIRTARAKGLSDARVIAVHALRNSLIPVVTILGVQMAILIGGTVIIEEIFALPGIGRMALNAISQRDYVVVQAVILVIAVLVVATNFVVDALYTVIDPRITK